jgi:hypothetical protein
LILKEY